MSTRKISAEQRQAWALETQALKEISPLLHDMEGLCRTAMMSNSHAAYMAANHPDVHMKPEPPLELAAIAEQMEAVVARHKEQVREAWGAPKK